MREKNIKLYIVLFSQIALFLAIIILKIQSTSLHTVAFLCSLSITLFIISSFYLRVRKLNVYFIFIILTYVFHFGQVFLYIFGINNPLPPKFNINYYETSVLVNSLYYSLIVIVIFQIVGFLLLKKIINHTINISKKQIADNKIDSSFFIIMILITILPYLYVDISQMLLASELGYVDAYKFGNSYFLSLFVNFFLISLFGFLTSTNNRKLGKMIIFIFAIWNVIKMFTVGNRSQPMAILLALVFIYISISKPKKIKIKPIHIVLGLLILLLLPYIAYIRNSTSNTNEYSNFIFYLLNDNPISYLLAEFGGTILTLFTVIDIVPEIVSFSNGLTYLGSLTILLPFSTTIFGGYFSAHISVGETMNSFFGGGLGGSWIAELYFNFGYFGILLVPIYSFCIKRISDMIDNNIVPKYTINRALMFYMLIPLFIFPRGYFYTFVSYLNVYIYVAIAYFVYRRLRLGE